LSRRCRARWKRLIWRSVMFSLRPVVCHHVRLQMKLEVGVQEHLFAGGASFELLRLVFLLFSAVATQSLEVDLEETLVGEGERKEIEEIFVKIASFAKFPGFSAFSHFPHQLTCCFSISGSSTKSSGKIKSNPAPSTCWQVS
jgi:hypothetical protein